MKEISLTQGKVALVDDKDFEWLNQWKWHTGKRPHVYYAVRRGGKKRIYMHRIILQSPKGLVADHINGDGLCNLRSNLRACTYAQNSMNRHKVKGSSKYRGTCWHIRDRRWYASIKVSGKNLHLGSFLKEKEAARAYDKKASETFGEFARLNFSKIVVGSI